MGGGSPQFRQIFKAKKFVLMNTVFSPFWSIFSFFGPFAAPILILFDAKTPILALVGKILLGTLGQSGGFSIKGVIPLIPPDF